MLLVVDARSGVPAYRQIMEQITFQVASGRLEPNAEMPSTRALSAQLKLNPMTVSKAYSLLERDGVLEYRRGQTLVVRAMSENRQITNKIAELKRALVEPAAIAKQLGIPPEEAVALFSQILSHTSAELPSR